MGTGAKSERILNELIDMFHNPEFKNGISQEIFQEKVGSTSRGTMYRYINLLQEKGYQLNKRTDHKVVFYYLEKEPETSNYEPITADTFYKYLIIKTLESHQDGMIFKSHEKLRKEKGRGDKAERESKYGDGKFACLQDYLSNEDSTPHTLVDIGDSKFRAILKDLVDEGKINSEKIIDKNGKVYGKNIIYYPKPKKESYLQLSDHDLSRLFFGVSTLSTRDTANTQSLLDKIAIELGNYYTFSIGKTNFIIYGHKNKSLQEIQDEFEIISKTNYKNKVLRLTVSNEGMLVQFFFSVGKIVYVEALDEFYLMGKRAFTPNDDGDYAYISLSSIQVASDTTTNSAEYGASLYEKFFNNMLKIGMDEQIDFRALIKDGFLTKENGKVTLLSKNRKCSHAHLFPLSFKNAFEYIDTISDTAGIKEFILGIGRDCIVTNPPELAAQFKEELEKTLLEYKEAGFDV